MKCEFCQRIGHTIHFCPSLPTRPDIADREEYIEKLMHSLYVHISILKNSCTEVPMQVLEGKIF